MQLPVLLVFSHLRWGFACQRPQQLLSRLAGRWRVVVVEEPRHAPGAMRLEIFEAAPHLTVLTPHTPVDAEGFQDSQTAALKWLLRQYVDARGLHLDAIWLTTPMALPLANAMGADCLVYDCMEEPSAGSSTPMLVRQREAALMHQAALVLAGGPALFKVRKSLHTHAHCLPSGVDMAHFSPVKLKPTGPLVRRAHELQSGLPRQRLGFAGIIDARLDLNIITALAESHPGWSLIMVGPIVGLDAARLPRRPNIHWLGPQSYELLPYLMAGWDLAMMPFVLDESTRFLNPVQALESMAAGLPVVGTPLLDVQALYFPTVTIASPEGFVAACEDVLAEGTLERCARLVDIARRAVRHSWEDTADTVHELLEEALAGVTEALPDDPDDRLGEATELAGRATSLAART